MLISCFIEPVLYFLKCQVQSFRKSKKAKFDGKKPQYARLICIFVKNEVLSRWLPFYAKTKDVLYAAKDIFVGFDEQHIVTKYMCYGANFNEILQKLFFPFFFCHNKQDCNSSYFCYLEDLQNKVFFICQNNHTCGCNCYEFIFFRQINVIYAIETFLR